MNCDYVHLPQQVTSVHLREVLLIGLLRTELLHAVDCKWQHICEHHDISKCVIER